MMGGWRLEVFRMACYVSFPVLLLFSFNKYVLYTDPEYFARKRRELYPERPGSRELINACIKKHQDRLDKQWEEENRLIDERS